MRCTLGVDIGTSSSKGVLVGVDGTIIASASRVHDVVRPHTGWVEMDGDVWWAEFVSIARELLDAVPEAEVVGVGVSGMGPCILLADEHDRPVRPAILYGVDTRSTAQIERMTIELGVDAITRVGGSTLTSQAGVPRSPGWLRRSLRRGCARDACSCLRHGLPGSSPARTCSTISPRARSRRSTTSRARAGMNRGGRSTREASSGLRCGGRATVRVK